MARFDLSKYETVADRIVKFWADYPAGRIHTQLVNHADGIQSQFIVKAAIYKDAADSSAWATGYAEEQFSTKGPNETSPLENCETSAIGRALANAGYATSSETRPSREEMAKANRGGIKTPAREGQITPEQIVEVREAAKGKGVEGDELRRFLEMYLERPIAAFSDVDADEVPSILAHLA